MLPGGGMDVHVVRVQSPYVVNPVLLRGKQTQQLFYCGSHNVHRKTLSANVTVTHLVRLTDFATFIFWITYGIFHIFWVSGLSLYQT